MAHLKFIERSLFWVIICLAVVLCIPAMSRGFFYDELYVVTHFLQSHRFLDVFSSGDDLNLANHLGYTILAYFLSHFLGLHEWVVRLPALIFGVASIFILWLFVRRYIGKTTALISSFLLALSPPFMAWSTSARGYSASLFFAMFSTYLYFLLLDKPSKKLIFMLALTNVLSLSFHVFCLALILAQLFHLICFAIDNRREFLAKKAFLLSGMTAVGCSLFFSALIYLPLRWKMLVFNASMHKELFPNFPMVLLKDLLSVPIWPLGVVLLAWMVIGLINKKLRFVRSYILFLFLVPLLVWVSKPWYLFSRFFAFLLPFIFLLIAQGIVLTVKYFQGRFKVVIFLIIGLILSFVIWFWRTQPSTMVEDFNGQYREIVGYAEKISSDDTNFCAFGRNDDFFQFYSNRPIKTFKTYNDFQLFYHQQDSILCFATIGPPMEMEHKKILIFMLNNNFKGRVFKDLWLFAIK